MNYIVWYAVVYLVPSYVGTRELTQAMLRTGLIARSGQSNAEQPPNRYGIA